ncbi:MAG: ABC transporter permease [Burkholderiaceae bacterium]
MNAGPILDNAALFAHGTLTTIALLAAALVVGGALAIPLAIVRTSRGRLASRTVWAFTYVVRGTPLLVQLFLLYYGLAQFDAVRASVAWPLLKSAWFCAALAMAINTCAYTTEMLAGAIRALPHGEIEAALAIGMSPSQRLRRIVLPLALRRSLPAYSNEVVMMLHGTSLASIVTLMDITGVARDVNARFYLPFESFIAAAALYLLLTFALIAAFRCAEQRWLAPLRARA